MSSYNINLDACSLVLEYKFKLFALSFEVKYSGTKSYNESFKDDGLKEEIKSTTFSTNNLVPGSQYNFEVYVSSVCGKSSSAYVKVETRMEGKHFWETLI